MPDEDNNVGGSLETMTSHATPFYTGSIIPYGGLSSLNAQAFSSYLSYFPEAIAQA